MIDWTDYGPGAHRVTCPACGRGERDRSLGLTIGVEGVGVCHCFRCAFTESYRPEGGARSGNSSTSPRKAVTPKKFDTLSAYGRDVWTECTTISDHALTYLKSRRCRIPPESGDLRWHPTLKHPSGYVGAALVGLITDALTGKPISLHRTWIQPDGCKAEVNPPRLLLGGHRKKGGVIRLWPDEAVTTGLGVAEGIETALSLAWGFAPVWACLDAGNLAAFPVLPSIESLLIGADNDQAGIVAANECALRWVDANAEVYVTRQSANDLNDVLVETA